MAELNPEGPPRDHMCQTGCGQRAEIVVLRLTDSEVDIVCEACNLIMWAAILAKTAEINPDLAAILRGEAAAVNAAPS